MSWVLGLLAGLSLALLLWQWVEAARFPLHQRGRADGFAPGVTLFKPLKGCDAETEACLRSWLQQDYAGPVQALFAVAAEDDPAVPLVRQLLAEHARPDAALVVCRERLGPNSKVSKLAQLEAQAAHEILVVSDADVHVPPDFLAQLVAPFRDPAVGLVNPFYRQARSGPIAMRWEALAVNADFWSSVLQATRLGPMRFALGAVMAVRREAVQRLGGFRSLVNFLADDFELGRRVAALAPPAGAAGERATAELRVERRGAESDRYRIELCPVVVECRESPRGWGAIWRHQLRWARTIRHCQPWPYAFSLLGNPMLWPALWLVLEPDRWVPIAFGLCLLARLAMAAHCQWRLTRSWAHLPWLWLAPVKDLLQAVLWALSFVGNVVEWRGERFVVRRGGELRKAG